VFKPNTVTCAFLCQTAIIIDLKCKYFKVEQPLVGCGANMTGMIDVTGFKPQHPIPLSGQFLVLPLFMRSFAGPKNGGNLRSVSVLFSLLNIYVFYPTTVMSKSCLHLPLTKSNIFTGVCTPQAGRYLNTMPPLINHSQQIAIPHGNSHSSHSVLGLSLCVLTWPLVDSKCNHSKVMEPLLGALQT
jgi:hypothetical protein